MLAPEILTVLDSVKHKGEEKTDGPRPERKLAPLFLVTCSGGYSRFMVSAMIGTTALASSVMNEGEIPEMMLNFMAHEMLLNKK